VWFKFESRLWNSDRFTSFFARGKTIFGIDTRGKHYKLAKYRDIDDLKFALNNLGEKLDSD
jgi:hypothetical protein